MVWFPAAALVILVIGFTLIVREISAHDRRRK
jgi:ABC-type dipeptide/oligopeptide/nickel transport system permease subunit